MNAILLLLCVFWLVTLIAAYKLGERKADKELIAFQKQQFNTQIDNINKAMALSSKVVDACSDMKNAVERFDLWEITCNLHNITVDLDKALPRIEDKLTDISSKIDFTNLALDSNASNLSCDIELATQHIVDLVSNQQLLDTKMMVAMSAAKRIAR
ncbi:hypothetical protein YI89_002907 [Salmonella enterica subsp. enterica]|nr:hypothetical protein [Salmonella enterica subsp. enterica]